MKKQILVIKLESKYSGKKQLEQMLKEEVKTEHIKSFEIKRANIIYRITEAYENRIMDEFDDEEIANEEYERYVTSGDGGDYYLDEIISND